MVLDLMPNTVDFLQQKPEQKFTAREIAEWIFDNDPDGCSKKQKRSNARVKPLNTDSALLTQITGEIGAMRPQMQKKHPEIKTTESRPRKYYFTELTDRLEIDHAESIKAYPASKVKEHDLYPILSDFLWSEFEIYGKRIDEKQSKNSQGTGGNKWLYPDLVGMQVMSSDWHREIKDCVQQYFDKKSKLWSFEVKIMINRSNVREAFFQTVSNSSWANFGYLVATEITGVNTLKELRMLASLHGIGFIQLDAENPTESLIMIPAKERSEINWDTANRLTKENKNFLKYINLIRQFYQTGEINQSDWDMSSDRD